MGKAISDLVISTIHQSPFLSAPAASSLCPADCLVVHVSLSLALPTPQGKERQTFHFHHCLFFILSTHLPTLQMPLEISLPRSVSFEQYDPITLLPHHGWMCFTQADDQALCQPEMDWKHVWLVLCEENDLKIALFLSWLPKLKGVRRRRETSAKVWVYLL